MTILTLKTLSIGLIISLISISTYAQKLKLTETEIKVSKDVRKAGSYFGGGYDPESRNTLAIFSYQDSKAGSLFDVYRFENASKALQPKEGLTVDELAEFLKFNSTESDNNENLGQKYDGKTAILVRSNFIGRDIVIEKGSLTYERNLVVKAESMSNPFTKSSAWVIDKLLFKSNDKEKLKVGFMPIGSLVFEGIYEDDVLGKLQEAGNSGPSSPNSGLIGLGAALADQAKDGISAAKAGLNAAFMQENGKAVMIGRVVEKVNIKNPVPWNNNRLRVAIVDGANMSVEEKDTYVMPFAFIPAQSKAIQNNQQLLTLLVPLNSPNTVKEAKQYQMDKENRNRVMAAFISNKGELIDTVAFRSAGNNGKYKIYENQNAVYIAAVLDSKTNGFYNGNINKATHVQFTKIENGKLIFNSAFDISALDDKISTPSNVKIKKVKMSNLHLQEQQQLSNGEYLFFANDGEALYSFHIDKSGQLKRVYVTNRFDKASQIVDSKLVQGKNKQNYWMIRETPAGVSDTDISISESYSSTSDGMYRTRSTTATATPRNIFQIKAVVKMIPINTSNGKLGDQLQVGGKNYLVVGDEGFLLDDAGNMLMIGFDLEKRKSLYAISISE